MPRAGHNVPTGDCTATSCCGPGAPARPSSLRETVLGRRFEPAATAARPPSRTPPSRLARHAPCVSNRRARPSCSASRADLAATAPRLHHRRVSVSRPRALRADLRADDRSPGRLAPATALPPGQMTGQQLAQSQHVDRARASRTRGADGLLWHNRRSMDAPFDPKTVIGRWQFELTDRIRQFHRQRLTQKLRDPAALDERWRRLNARRAARRSRSPRPAN